MTTLEVYLGFNLGDGYESFLGIASSASNCFKMNLTNNAHRFYKNTYGKILC